MAEMLNFSREESENLKKFLQNFPKKETKTQYEEMRVEIDGITVTLYSTGKIILQGKDSKKVKEMILEFMAEEDEDLIFGIDETGRGENTGPFVIAGVLGKNSDFRELRDSKKIANIATKLEIVKEKCVFALIESCSAVEVDALRKHGETMNSIEAKIVNEMTEICLKRYPKARIMMDGAALKGVSKKVEFIVKGDDKVPVIGAASVLARNARDISEDKEVRKSWKNSD